MPSDPRQPTQAELLARALRRDTREALDFDDSVMARRSAAKKFEDPSHHPLHDLYSDAMALANDGKLPFKTTPLDDMEWARRYLLIDPKKIKLQHVPSVEALGHLAHALDKTLKFKEDLVTAPIKIAIAAASKEKLEQADDRTPRLVDQGEEVKRQIMEGRNAG